MSDQGEPDEPAGSGGPAGSDERGGGRDGGDAERGGAERGGRTESARSEGGGGAESARSERGGRTESARSDEGTGAESARSDAGDRAESARSEGDGEHASGFSAPVRIAVGILGPVLLTTAYFTLPFDPLGPDHRILAWVICAGLLTLLALGMVVTTNRALTDDGGRWRHPGVGILLLSWAAILVFAASYWAMATHHNQFVGLQTRLDALYFTGVTMATVGYGDIHPSGQLGRAVVLVQLVYTFAFLVSGVTAIRTRNQARRAQRMSRGG